METKKMKHPNGNPLTEAFRQYAFWFHRLPGRFLWSASEKACSSASSCIMLFWTSRMLGMLSAGDFTAQAPAAVIQWIGWWSLCSALSRYCSIRADACRKEMDVLVQKRDMDSFLEMDYQDVQSANIQKLYSQIQQTDNYSGFGLRTAFDLYDSAAEGIASLAGGLYLCFFAYPAASSLSGKILTAAVLIGSILLVRIREWFAARFNDLFSKGAEQIMEGNRKMTAYLELPMELSAAIDQRIYQLQEKLIDGYARKIQDEFSEFLRSQITPYRFFCGWMMGLMKYLPEALLYGWTALCVFQGSLSLSGLPAAAGGLLEAGSGAGKLFYFIQRTRLNQPALAAYESLHHVKNRMYQGSLSTEKRSDGKYQIEFRHVTYTYPGMNEPALKDVSFSFDIGRNLAVVGENGSGKSTFIKLLCRMMDPQEGEILLNGIDIKKYNYRQYQDLFSVVFQNFSLFPLSAAQNTACAVSLDRSKVRRCLNMAGLSVDGENAEVGLDDTIGRELDAEGKNVSGGQAQKIAIARAVYKDAPFMVLDEPTAALDPVSEEAVFSVFEEVSKNKTAVFISHRLSSCRFCDQIAVFDQGRLIELGSHESLLSDAGSQYSRLWNAQARYYTETRSDS